MMRGAAWLLVLVGLVVALASVRGTLVSSLRTYATGGQSETMPPSMPRLGGSPGTGITTAPATPPGTVIL